LLRAISPAADAVAANLLDRTFKAEQGAPKIIRIITSLMVILPVIHRLIHVDLAKQANTDFVAFGINDNILSYLIANDQV
jgi:hypothetical protein